MYWFRMTYGISLEPFVSSLLNLTHQQELRYIVMKWRFAVTQREQWLGFAQEWYWYAECCPWMMWGVSKMATPFPCIWYPSFPMHLLVAAPFIWRRVWPGRWTAVIHRLFSTLFHSVFPPFHLTQRWWTNQGSQWKSIEILCGFAQVCRYTCATSIWGYHSGGGRGHPTARSGGSDAALVISHGTRWSYAK